MAENSIVLVENPDFSVLAEKVAPHLSSAARDRQ